MDEKRATSNERAKRKRWVRVRLQTEAGTLVGSVKLEGFRSSLYELLDDDRAYLGLCDAAWLGASQHEDFVAIHKSAIRSVTLEPARDTAVVDGSDD